MPSTVRPRVVYIDEVVSDLEKYSHLIGSSRVVDVVGLPPPANLDPTIVQRHAPDAIIIDYELTKARLEDGTHVNYMGGSLAARLRENSPDTPILILTRRSLLRRYPSLASFPESVDQLGAVDFILYKDDVASHPDLAGGMIQAMVDGYLSIKEAPNRSWAALVSAIGADDEEAEQLQESAPPLAGVASDANPREWSVSGAARWVFRVLFRFPGVLYDDLHAATSLGISLDSFQSTPVQELVSAAVYSGPFSGLSRRWWKGRLFRIAHELVSEVGLAPPLSTSFEAALTSRGVPGVKPSICSYSGRPHADIVCCIRNEPVLREFSLEYFPDNRPPSMDPARVSFKGVLESTKFDASLLSAEGRLVEEEVRREVIARTRPATPPS